jgi:hypothetical protein
MSDITKEFEERFNSHISSDDTDAYYSIPVSMLDAWLSERSKKEDNILDRAIQLEDENKKLKSDLVQLRKEKFAEIDNAVELQDKIDGLEKELKEYREAE